MEGIWNTKLLHETWHQGLFMRRLREGCPCFKQPPEIRTDWDSLPKGSYRILKLSCHVALFLLQFLNPTLDHTFQRAGFSLDSLISICQQILSHSDPNVKTRLTQRSVILLWLLGFRFNDSIQNLNNIILNTISVLCHIMLVQVSPQKWGPTSFLSHLSPVLLTSGLTWLLQLLLLHLHSS